MFKLSEGSPAVLMILLLVVGSSLPAQGVAPHGSDLIARELSRRVEVRIALVERLPASSSTPLISRRGAFGDYVIFDNATLSQESLAKALFHLAILRDLQGDTASVDGVIRVPETRVGSTLFDREGRTLNGLVSRIYTAEKLQVEKLGAARVISVYLPSRSMRESYRTRQPKANR